MKAGTGYGVHRWHEAAWRPQETLGGDKAESKSIWPDFLVPEPPIQ